MKLVRAFVSMTLALGVSALCGNARAAIFDDQGPMALGTQPCNGTGCWTNYARIADMNGDGNLDLVMVNCAGFFANPGAQPLVVYENDGAGHFTDASASVWGGYSGRVRQIAIGDVDGDGDPDVFAPDAGGQADALFINQGNGTYANEGPARIGTSSHAGATRFADVDDDGDLDLFVADGYALTSGKRAHLYLNDGMGHFVEAAANATPSDMGADVDDFDVLDVDGDFDLDLLINVHDQNDLLWINDGTGKFTDGSAGLPAQAASLHYDPGVCDVDGDGDLDVVIDNTGPAYQEQLLLNDGKGAFTDATAQIVGNTPNADDNGIACIDYDGDGDMDLVVAALSTSGERLFQNDGTGHFTKVTGAFTPLVDPTLWIDFGDLNGDGRIDALTAQGESMPQLERVYLANAGVAVDTRPPAIIALSGPKTTGDETHFHFRVSDSAVTDAGPRLARAFLLVDGVSHAATFMGGDLYRVSLYAGDVSGASTVVACAEDANHNLVAGCAGGTGGAGGATTSSTSTGQTSGGTSGGAGGSGGAGVDGGGCGCRVGDRGELGGSLLLTAIVSTMLMRRRRLRGENW